MKLGVENKKQIGILGGLALVLGYLAYSNLFSGSGAGPAQPANPQPASNSAAASIAALGGAEAAARPTIQPVRTQEFRPVLRSKRSEERINPATVDPALHLELLERLQAVAPDGGGRNLFQFSAPPPPKPSAQAAAKLSGPEPIVALQPKPAPPVVAAPPSEPPPPPIPLKFYAVAVARASGKKSAFFVDGEDIYIGSEGEIVAKQYRIVKIGVNSVTLEDIKYKREQQIPLEENASLPGQ